jgi:hypothetical protein
VNIEADRAVVAHLQQERLAVVLISNVDPLHNLENLQRFFAQGFQYFLSISLHCVPRIGVAQRSPINDCNASFAWLNWIPKIIQRTVVTKGAVELALKFMDSKQAATRIYKPGYGTTLMESTAQSVLMLPLAVKVAPD